MTIVTAIENPSEFVRTATDYIKATEKTFYTRPKNMPGNGAEVPAGSSYELALRVIAENCRRANKAIGLSLWAIFDTWDEDWTEAVEGDDADWILVDRYETPFKPLRSSR